MTANSPNHSVAERNRDAWQSNWATRLAEYLKEQNVSGLSEYLGRYPNVGYDKLPSRFPFPIAPVQIYRTHMNEAAKAGQVREAAMDVLVRSLNRFMCEGWGVGDDSWKRAKVFSEFATIVALNSNLEDIDLLVRNVFDALKAGQPPLGWLPKNVADPLIQLAFTNGWPVRKNP
jgi:hypothetical protein